MGAPAHQSKPLSSPSKDKINPPVIHPTLRGEAMPCSCFTARGVPLLSQILRIAREPVVLLKKSGKSVCDYQGWLMHVGRFSSNRMAMPERACSMRG